MNGEH